MPSADALTYIIQAAPPKVETEEKKESAKKTSTQTADGNDVTVIFCIDVSGSMGGSRLNCVKDVLRKSIKQIHDDHPSRKVGIVLFESQIHVIGDGTQNMLYV